MTDVIDFHVRLPLELRPSEELPDDYLRQYDKVLNLTATRTRTLEDLLEDMDGSGVNHTVVHAEHEYGDVADSAERGGGQGGGRTVPTASRGTGPSRSSR